MPGIQGAIHKVSIYGRLKNCSACVRVSMTCDFDVKHNGDSFDRCTISVGLVVPEVDTPHQE